MWTPTPRAEHNRAGLRYGSDLTDAEWAILELFLPHVARPAKRRRKPRSPPTAAGGATLRRRCSWPENYEGQLSLPLPWLVARTR